MAIETRYFTLVIEILHPSPRKKFGCMLPKLGVVGNDKTDAAWHRHVFPRRLHKRFRCAAIHVPCIDISSSWIRQQQQVGTQVDLARVL